MMQHERRNSTLCFCVMQWYFFPLTMRLFSSRRFDWGQWLSKAQVAHLESSQQRIAQIPLSNSRHPTPYSSPTVYIFSFALWISPTRNLIRRADVHIIRRVNKITTFSWETGSSISIIETRDAKRKIQIQNQRAKKIQPVRGCSRSQPVA